MKNCQSIVPINMFTKIRSGMNKNRLTAEESDILPKNSNEIRNGYFITSCLNEVPLYISTAKSKKNVLWLQL